MFGLGTWELLIVFGIVVLLFGAKRIPELASSMGRGIRGFQRALRGEDKSLPGEIPAPPKSRDDQ